MENIVVGDKTYVAYQSPQSSLGTAIWRLDEPSIPAMFRSSITHSAVLNGPKTNINETVLIEVPIPVTVDGTTTAQNKFVARFSYSALQNVVDADRSVLALDALVAFITARKSAILAGRTV